MIITDKEFELAPAGTHTAILYSHVDLGTSTNETKFGLKRARRLRLTWELCDEKMKDGRPFSISKTYTPSANQKSKFYNDVKSWLGEPPRAGFNTTTLVGKACNLTVVHEEYEGKIYANVGALAPLKKNEVKPDQQNDSFIFDADYMSQLALDALPEFLREMVKKSEEYAAFIAPPEPKPVDATLNDEVPF